MSKRSKSLKIACITLLILIILVVGGAVVVRQVYESNLEPVSSSPKVALVEVPIGATPHDIAIILEEQGLIKKAWAFEWYIRNADARDQLKAGTYELAPNLGVRQIVNIITDGEVSTNLVTILPGKQLAEIKSGLVDAGFDGGEIDEAMQPNAYKGHPALVDKPSDADLEGYIYPESFQVTADSHPSKIIQGSLDQLSALLTADVRAKIAKQGLTVHEAIILASIIEKEVPTDEDRKMAAQVFLSRLSRGMALESNATDGYPDSYDTYQISGLPPGPLSNFNASALLAVAEPAKTDYLFFVTGKDGQTRFSSTLQQHEQLIQEHGVKGVE